MANKNEFKLPYAGIDEGLLIGQNGDFSVVVRVTNALVRFAGAPAAYDEFHQLLINIIKILGGGYLLQKQDVICRGIYPDKPADEYLQQKYNAHFAGRKYLKVDSYLTITRQVKKGAFYVHDAKAVRDFRQAVEKVLDVLRAGHMEPVLLDEPALNLLVMQVLSMKFSGPVALDNISPTDNALQMGERSVRSISLINIDSIDLPQEVSTHIELNEKETLRGFPVDFLSFLFNVPDAETVLFNQVIDIPHQSMTLRKLELKKKRHSGIPDPANQICVDDIDRLLTDVARENQLLVNCHFNIVVAAANENLQRSCNYIESSLFQLGIIPSKNAYNQLELFRTVLPGNAVALKDYDLFLTTCDAAACFFFKEALPKDELSDFLIRFTDRQGIPVGIDPADLPMRNGRINNRNKFVLGPSGSGKSFFMNALIEQYCLYNMDIVIVDTGHSYSGLCSYYKGKYITYTEEKPITMNPFQIRPEEYNIEKKDFLVTLLGLLWKGADGQFSQVERDVIAHVLSAYYGQYFDQDNLPGLSRHEHHAIRKQVMEEMRSGPLNVPEDTEIEMDWPGPEPAELSVDDDQLVTGMCHNSEAWLSPFRAALEQKYNDAVLAEKRRKHKEKYPHAIEGLSFNSFYEFALFKVPEIKQEERIPFEIDEFRYVLKKFHRGGEFGQILNEPADESLFSAPLLCSRSIRSKKTGCSFRLSR